MGDSDDAKLKDEIEKISRDVKRVMKKVEALYPTKKAENGPDEDTANENAGGPASSGNGKTNPE